MKLLAELRSLERDFPPVLRRIGEFVANNAERVVYQTITELGEEANCSIASIQRFYRQLGFKTYGDFKLRLATELASRNSKATDEPRTRLDALVEEGIEALVHTKDLVAQEQIRPTAERLLKCERISVFGVAASAVVAHFFRFKFLRLGCVVDALSDPHMATIAIASMARNDAFVVLSSSGSSVEPVRLTELAKEQQLWTVGIVNRAKSPMTKFLDQQFVAAAPESPLTGGSFSAKTCQMLVVEALYQEALAVSESARKTDQSIAEVVAHRAY